MAYATLTNMQTRFGSDAVLLVSDRDGDGIADTGVIDGALDDATEEIDSYLAAKYQLPLATVPGVIERYCCDIAMYLLSDTADVLTEERKNRYEKAVSWLSKLAKGIVSLGLESEPETIPHDFQVTSNTRVFTRTSMGGL